MKIRKNPQENPAIKSNFRTMPMQVREISDEKRTVELSFSSEKPVDRWFGQEILCHDEECVDLTRLQNVGSVLFHHGLDPVYGSLPIARIVSLRIDSETKRGKAVVSFDTDEKSDLLYQKVKSGSLKGISVGYIVNVYEEVRAGKTSSNGRFTGPCYVATKWEPMEISFEPVPADDDVGAGRNQNPEREEHGMSVVTDKNNPNNPVAAPEHGGERGAPQPAAPAPAAVPTVDGAASERQRCTEIYSLCRSFGVEPEEYIQDGSSVDQVRAAILESLKRSRTPLTSHVQVVADEEDKYRDAARDGLLLRMGETIDKPAPGAESFRGMSLHQLMADCAMRCGVKDAHRLSPDELWREMGMQSRGQFADTNSFVSIINSTLHATIARAYATAPTTYQYWTSVGSNPDFKKVTRYRLAATGEMQEIPENGEFKTVSGRDEGVETGLKTYGKKFGFSRQTIINDDLGTVSRMITAQVRSNQRFINQKCYEALTQNAKIFDGKNLFDASHNNLFTGAAPSIASFNEMIVAMAKQKDINGKDVLNIKPHFVLAPVALGMAIRQILESTADPDATNSGVMNPMKGAFQLITDAQLDIVNPKGYYAVADPNEADGIEVTYLNGNRTPTLESKVSWDTLGIEYRMFHDFGINIIDYRGMSYNPGK
nr:MAG TPA: major capsid protein [Caudoviricetes sp.]